MTEKLKQTIKEGVAKLPKESQDAVNSLDWASVAEEIGKKYLLGENEINNFQVETFLVLIGLTDLNFFATSIENGVGTTKDDAENMAEEVLTKIFTPISNIMEENIKKNLGSKKPSPDQNLDFILSGGDYSAFLGEQGETTRINPTDTKKNIPVKPRRITDIKSKFTI